MSTYEDELMNSLNEGDMLKVICSTDKVMRIPILEWTTTEDGTRIYIIGTFDETSDGTPQSEPHSEFWYWNTDSQKFISTCGEYHLPEDKEVIIESAQEQEEGPIAAAMFLKGLLIEQQGEIAVSH